ncbi:serine hydroxymethyltransferase [Candidatus Synchoanobacter obligatus]|uniref:Serine hydroxymethyltransferase n=1 Tax=Candidatus Synchoanobacter obligatus TaxID=2919597 RepID=A0ABT1L5J0_9GAMM|nr:serine hydroxymethyltransferase [Candidatus Synchoanobacter obligatus]MCP8352447.1 serine hydroxymethyltransferase [Candidatus Synchoanobacter obligatus]
MTNNALANLAKIDQDVAIILAAEYERQSSGIQLIASENFASKAVLMAQGSIATNKYAEGLPGRRYYGGCEHVDAIETLAIARAKELFQADFVNVQPHSGSSANFAVFQALLKPGDQILGMDLNAGGHLTHGHSVNQSGKIYQAASYGVNQNGFIDYDEVESLAKATQPKLIIAGFSAYSQIIDWDAFAQIAKKVNAYLLADMAHVSGLVAAGVYPSPVPYADIVTSTTHKTLRGPRGGMILAKDGVLAKQLNRSVFPGMQGGPLMHVIAAKAVCYHEAMQEAFQEYQKQVVKNAQAMAGYFIQQGYDVVSNGTECHMFLLALTGSGINGAEAQKALEDAGIVVNKNSIPNDPLPANKTSGIRIGSQAMTSRGVSESGAIKIAEMVVSILKDPTALNIQQVRRQVDAFVATLFPVPRLGE